MDELDLYASNLDFSWKKAIAIAAAFALMAGLVGYRWMTTGTPVSREDAVAMFQAEQERSAARDRRDAGAGEGRRGRTERNGDGSEAKRTATRRTPTGGNGSANAGRVSASGAGAEGAAEQDQSEPRAATRQRPEARRLPREGVYSWATRGFESAGGTRRSFPSESQRIVTLDGDRGWSTHHYFSEQREIWSRFVIADDAAHMAYQRNKVVFGPVTNDSSITFSPPMLVGPIPERVGESWHGSWEGKTYGDYEGRIFEHGRMNVGGESVEVWGIELDIRLRGEQSGRVQAKVWLAPEHTLTVREEYVQDVKADVGNYHAEWSMTLKSLQPAR